MTSTLVVGAGELGTAVLKALATHPQFQPNSITVLLRPSTLSNPSPSKKTDISTFTSLGISTLAGDIVSATESSLATLFTPYHTIIGCTGMTYPPGTQLKIAKAVLQAKVPRYLPWQFGVDYDIIGHSSSQGLFAEQLDVRALLRGQESTSWVIVSTGMFMSFLFEAGFGVVGAGWDRVSALGEWGNGVCVTDVGDIGRVVADIVLAPGQDQVQGVVYTSGDTVTYQRLADILEHVLQRKVDRQLLSVQHLQEALAKDPTDGMKKYRVVFAEGKGVMWDMDVTYNVKRGLALKTVDEWVKEKLGERE